MELLFEVWWHCIVSSEAVCFLSPGVSLALPSCCWWVGLGFELRVALWAQLELRVLGQSTAFGSVCGWVDRTWRRVEGLVVHILG